MARYRSRGTLTTTKNRQAHRAADVQLRRLQLRQPWGRKRTPLRDDAIAPSSINGTWRLKIYTLQALIWIQALQYVKERKSEGGEFALIKYGASRLAGGRTACWLQTDGKAAVC